MTRTGTREEDGLENSIVLWLEQTLEELIKEIYIGEGKKKQMIGCWSLVFELEFDDLKAEDE